MLNGVPGSLKAMWPLRPIPNIMQSKKIVLMAFGEKKAKAIKEMIEGPITEEVPASILQKHPDVTVIVDEAAAQELDDKYKN